MKKKDVLFIEDEEQRLKSQKSVKELAEIVTQLCIALLVGAILRMVVLLPNTMGYPIGVVQDL